MLASEKDWIVFTADKRISKNKAERAAYRQAGLLGFALAPGFRKVPTNKVAATLVSRWPDMERLMQLVATSGLYEIPIGTGGFRPLPL